VLNGVKLDRRAFLRLRSSSGVTVTANRDFFVTSIGEVPRIDRERWALMVDGLVARPLALDWTALRRLPAVEVMQTIAGRDGDMGNAVWCGVPVMTLLERAGLGGAARRAVFHAADGYTTGIDLWWLAREGAVLAYMMNGLPLPEAHGCPLRLLVPGLPGYKLSKWITRIELVDYPYLGYWERRGLPDAAAVTPHVQCRSSRAGVRGAVDLRGVAFAGDRLIEQVAVQVDAGPWLEAALTRPGSPGVWTAWYLQWTPGVPGLHTLVVRAIDSRGCAGTDRLIVRT
jgi:DMSO/TMAO reductase YedYZ molybdopterin-dependent catalytic subunit